ncbi:tat protein [Simian immunodeficiency virus]|uniref:Protein Tat n=1 Tax=Simian immunodeficiency virus TaxID=11723 RepID=Q699V6_SIV|nr:tat protein [Simian immunodeficiency virus]
MEEIDPFKETANTPHPNCMCKACTMHCQLCFMQKGLGIYYGSRRRKRRRGSSFAANDKDHQEFIPEHCVEDIPLCRPLPQRRWKCFNSEEKETKVEKASRAGGRHRPEDS